MRIYRPARQYLPAAMAAATLSAFSAWCALRWPWAWIPCAAFVVSAALLSYLATRPPITVSDAGLRLGERLIPWSELRRVDTTSWSSPLVLKLTLADSSTVRLIYPGELISSERLLRQIRREARRALLDHEGQSRSWDEDAPISARLPVRRPERSRVLRNEDEQEVERLYRQLKSVGRLDASSSPDERQDA